MGMKPNNVWLFFVGGVAKGTSSPSNPLQPPPLSPIPYDPPFPCVILNEESSLRRNSLRIAPCRRFKFWRQEGGRDCCKKATLMAIQSIVGSLSLKIDDGWDGVFAVCLLYQRSLFVS